jgi:hypothetical protein
MTSLGDQETPWDIFGANADWLKVREASIFSAQGKSFYIPIENTSDVNSALRLAGTQPLVAAPVS